MSADNHKFAPLGIPARIWAVSAIHADAARLMEIHDSLYPRLSPGDRIVYLGNYTGFGPRACETVDELLTFRRAVLALPGAAPSDMVYLRGRQEEMWHKLLQIQFAPRAAEVMRWMLHNGGLASALASYGLDPAGAVKAAQEGVMSLTRWTARLRQALRRHQGHETFTAQWRRAAYTNLNGPSPLLFVHCGINPQRPLHEQGDSFWWAGSAFNGIDQPYGPFRKVVRGFDPGHEGVRINCVTATLDGGCGFGGNLVCAGFTGEGGLFDMIEV